MIFILLCIVIFINRVWGRECKTNFFPLQSVLVRICAVILSLSSTADVHEGMCVRGSWGDSSGELGAPLQFHKPLPASPGPPLLEPIWYLGLCMISQLTWVWKLLRKRCVERKQLVPTLWWHQGSMSGCTFWPFHTWVLVGIFSFLIVWILNIQWTHIHLSIQKCAQIKYVLLEQIRHFGKPLNDFVHESKF